MMTQHTIHYLRPLYAVLKLCSEANIGYCRRTRSGSRIIYITDLNFIGGSVILTLLFGGLRGPSVEVGATDAPATSTCGPWERTLHTLTIPGGCPGTVVVSNSIPTYVCYWDPGCGRAASIDATPPVRLGSTDPTRANYVNWP